MTPPSPPMPATSPLSPTDLDAVYTELCQALTTLGEPQAPLMLARFALLAITELDDADTARRLIAAAADGLGPTG